MIIYRIESFKGIGPYTHVKGDIRNWTDIKLHTVRYNRPPPCYEFPNNKSKDYYFGFDTKEKLRKWFFEFKKELSRYFYISEYEIEEEYVLIGKTQAMFSKKHAKLINKTKITQHDKIWY